MDASRITGWASVRLIRFPHGSVFVVSVLLRYLCRLDRACCCKSGFGVSVKIASILFWFPYVSFLCAIEAHPASADFINGGLLMRHSSTNFRELLLQ